MLPFSAPSRPSRASTTFAACAALPSWGSTALRRSIRARSDDATRDSEPRALRCRHCRHSRLHSRLRCRACRRKNSDRMALPPQRPIPQPWPCRSPRHYRLVSPALTLTKQSCRPVCGASCLAATPRSGTAHRLRCNRRHPAGSDTNHRPRSRRTNRPVGNCSPGDLAWAVWAPEWQPMRGRAGRFAAVGVDTASWTSGVGARFRANPRSSASPSETASVRSAASRHLSGRRLVRRPLPW